MKAYEDPSIETLGTVAELTMSGGHAKCGGSGDTFFPSILENTIRNVDVCP